MTMAATDDRMISDYLADVEHEIADLPTQRRQELLADLAEHITVSRAELPADNEDALRDLLHRLGSPAQIADQARADAGLPEPAAPQQAARVTHGFEIITVVVLLAGIVVPVLAGLAGLIMAWASRVWSRRDKLWATGIAGVAGVLPGLLLVGSGLTIGYVELLLLVPILASTVGTAIAAVFLAVRLRRYYPALKCRHHVRFHRATLIADGWAGRTDS